MNQYKEIVKRSRALRQRQTSEEKIFWEMVRNRRFKNLKFTRQFPVIHNRIKSLNYFILDFYCHEKSTAVELDGKIHEKQKEYDQNRDAILNELGIKVIRIKNEEFDDLEELKRKLKRILEV